MNTDAAQPSQPPREVMLAANTIGFVFSEHGIKASDEVIEAAAQRLYDQKLLAALPEAPQEPGESEMDLNYALHSMARVGPVEGTDGDKLEGVRVVLNTMRQMQAELNGLKRVTYLLVETVPDPQVQDRMHSEYIRLATRLVV